MTFRLEQSNLPIDAEIVVKYDQKVEAGVTVLGFIREEQKQEYVKPI